ncbi:hypothetical protein GW17_00031253 [Ensete ventricosum]|nr:hypothetical protein GW17_00031253 [Ensete ventricosum]
MEDDILLGVTVRAEGVELFGSESRSILKSACCGCNLHVVISPKTHVDQTKRDSEPLTMIIQHNFLGLIIYIVKCESTEGTLPNSHKTSPHLGSHVDCRSTQEEVAGAFEAKGVLVEQLPTLQLETAEKDLKEKGTLNSSGTKAGEEESVTEAEGLLRANYYYLLHLKEENHFPPVWFARNLSIASFPIPRRKTMDPNPKSFPILSYVMSRIASFKAPQAVDHHDIEQPPPLDRPIRGVGGGDIDLVVERLPRLQHPALLASMASAITEVAQTRSVLRLLGDRPDHEAVDAARARLAEIDADLSRRLEEIVRTPRPEGVDRLRWRAEQAEREKGCRAEAEREKAALRVVIQLDEMHEAYEKLLREAENRLVKMYGSAAEGGDVGDGKQGADMGQEEGEDVNEEVIDILQGGPGKSLERVDLSGRHLRYLPEAFGKLRGLLYLNLSNNQLEVCHLLLSR